MEYLYHYTSIENLALILESRKIRFTSLNKVDDLNEGVALDIDEFGQFVFVSCWTSDSKESIPQWSIYGKGMSGVRIALPKYPFWHYSFSETPSIVKDQPFSYSSILKWGHIDNGFVVPQADKYLIKVRYTDDKAMLHPKIVEPTTKNGMKGIINHSHKIGIYKNRCWSFQREIRYRLVVHPLGGFTQSGNTEKDSVIKISPGHIDVPIRDDAFENMIVLLGPRHIESNSIIVEALLEKYNPRAKLKKESTLKIRK